MSGKPFNFFVAKTKCIHRITAADMPPGIDHDNIIMPCVEDENCPEKKKPK